MGLGTIAKLIAEDYADNAASRYTGKAKNIQEATNNWPSAKNAWEACNSEGFMDYFKAVREGFIPEGKSWFTDFDNNEKAELSAQALREVLRRDPYALQTLNNETLAATAREITILADDEAYDSELLHQIYKHYDVYEDKDFELFDLQKKTELVERLSEDQDVLNARANWDSLDLEERLDVARHIHQIQADVYGFKIAPISAEDLESDTVMGRHSAQFGKNEIIFNTNERSWWEKHIDGDPEMSINGNDFNDFLEVVTHESEHAFQYYLYQAMNDAWREELDILRADDKYRYSLDAEEIEALNEQLTEWMENKFPEMDPEARRQLIEGGGIREMAQMAKAGFYSKPQIKEGDSRDQEYEYYRTLPHEQNAWIMGEFFEKVFSPEGPEAIQNLKDRLAELESEKTADTGPSRTIDSTKSCDSLDGSVRRETIMSASL